MMCWMLLGVVGVVIVCILWLAILLSKIEP